MLFSLALFLVYAIPPLFGWWLAMKAPFGRRRFKRAVTIKAPLNVVWARLDPRGPEGGWAPLYETRNVVTQDDARHSISSARRPRFSDQSFTIVSERCSIDADSHCIQRIEREIDGKKISRDEAAKSAFLLRQAGAATRVEVVYERPVVGLLDYEMARLNLKADLAALHDAIVGRDPRATPVFRFAGWRMGFFGVISALIMIALLLAPAFYLALQAIGLPLEALIANKALGVFLLLLAGAMIAWITAIFVFCTLVHEIGHALALAAFGHRGIMVSLLPFGGGVALGARNYRSAFEAGVVSLAGPAFSALVALALMPQGDALATLMRYAVADPAQRASLPAPGAEAIFAITGALVALFTLLINVPNVLPWSGSDGAQALRTIFSTRKLQRAAAIALSALLAFAFARREDLLPFALLFIALSWFNRRRAAAIFDDDATGLGQRAAIAAGLALTIGLYAYEADLLRRIDMPAPNIESVADKS